MLRIKPSGWAAIAAVFALAALPRFLGLGYGLPQVYNSDEPHVVNMAVSLAGSLRPYSFKYPTLWPTLLAFFYGLWFLLWSGFGRLRSSTDFAALYGFHPTGFYLIARGLAAAAQLGGVWIVARAERGGGRERWPWAALILAVSPALVESAHAGKPDSLMFLLSAGSWACALGFLDHRRRGLLRASGFLAGLACSAQYTAAPAALVVPLAWLLAPEGPAPLSWLAESCALGAIGFLLGTPFALLDHARFFANWSDYSEYARLGRLRSHDMLASSRVVAADLWSFGGSWSGLWSIVGLAVLFRKNSRRAILLLGPIAACAALLCFSYGIFPRFLMGVYPALALLAGEGAAFLSGHSIWRKTALAAVFLLPGLFLSAEYDRGVLRTDTRAQSSAWVKAHIPAGAVLLTDLPHASPDLLMERRQCEELAARAGARGSPRAKLYRAMAARHPGGGWRVYRIKRSSTELQAYPRHVAESQADGDFLDLRPGLDPARAARVEWVITSSFGADPSRSPDLAQFFAELSSQARLIREFSPTEGAAAGPLLRIYRLPR